MSLNTISLAVFAERDPFGSALTFAEPAACFLYQSWAGYITGMFEYEFPTRTMGANEYCRVA